MLGQVGTVCFRHHPNHRLRCCKEWHQLERTGNRRGNRTGKELGRRGLRSKIVFFFFGTVRWMMRLDKDEGVDHGVG